MEKDFLPIGSVVLLRESTRRLMVIGYLQTTPGEKDRVYDYSGCLFPEGYMDGNHVFLFDAEQIEHVYFVGLQDEEQFHFRKKLEDAKKTIHSLRGEEDKV